VAKAPDRKVPETNVNKRVEYPWGRGKSVESVPAPFSQQPNPNPQVWTMRALLTAMTGWVRDDATPPPSMVPRLADGGLVAPDQVRFPPIPGVGYGGVTRPAILTGPRVYDTLHVLDRGPDYRAGDTSGVITREPPAEGAASYGLLVPQVDASQAFLCKSRHGQKPRLTAAYRA